MSPPTRKTNLSHHLLSSSGDGGTRSSAIVQRLQLFGTYSKFKQCVLYRIAKELATSEVQEVKQQWEKMNFGNVTEMGTIRLLDGLELEGYTVGEAEGSDLLKAIKVGLTTHHGFLSRLRLSLFVSLSLPLSSLFS